MLITKEIYNSCTKELPKKLKLITTDTKCPKCNTEKPEILGFDYNERILGCSQCRHVFTTNNNY